MAGIFSTIKLAGVLLLAIPAALAGLEFLLRGDVFVGSALLGLAVGLVAIQRLLTRPSDLPGLLVKRAVGSVVPDPEPEADDRNGDGE